MESRCLTGKGNEYGGPQSYQSGHDFALEVGIGKSIFFSQKSDEKSKHQHTVKFLNMGQGEEQANY